MTGVDTPIDAVITWVDGADPAHREKLQYFLGGATTAGSAATRFADRNEIDYCVASLLRHAPWIRTIHIVTDAQTPGLIGRLAGSAIAHRVRVVDHREIFAGFEQYLPTFSSLAIETMLWRIPGLAENFIYLNDDFQVVRPVASSDFFRGGSVVIRGRWRDVAARRFGHRLKALIPAWLRRKAEAASNHAAQQTSAAVVGFEGRYFQVPHCPHPMRRSTLEDFFRRFPQRLEDNLRSRIRSPEQLLATGLADHLELAAGTAIIDNRLSTIRLKPASQAAFRLRRAMRQADRNRDLAFSCVQSLDLASPAAFAAVTDWLDRRVGRLAAVGSGSVQIEGVDVDGPAHAARRLESVQQPDPAPKR